jgi:thiamine biosynthesis protein ThiI
MQVALRERCHPELLAILYRRLMVRVAERVAAELGAAAIATGENLGQVASQTLPNMRAIDAAATLPILRPLVTYDKEETVALARRIGTYDISIRPAEDCCQLFTPRHPATRVDLAQVLEEEAKVDLAPLLDACVAKIDVEKFGRRG